jgi:hypothetical protein
MILKLNKFDDGDDLLGCDAVSFYRQVKTFRKTLLPSCRWHKSQSHVRPRFMWKLWIINFQICEIIWNIAVYCIAVYCIAVYCIAVYCIAVYCIAVYCTPTHVQISTANLYCITATCFGVNTPSSGSLQLCQPVAYPGIFFGGGFIKFSWGQRTEKGDLGAVAP